MRIRISPQARADLDEIWFYIAEEGGSEILATRVIAAITDKFALFARFRILRVIHASRDAWSVFQDE